MISEQLLREMVRKIHACPELRGCRIGFYGNYQCRVLHSGYNVGPNSERVLVIIEEIITDDPKVLREMRQWAAAPGGNPAGVQNPSVLTERSCLKPEITGAAISCLLTTVAVVGVAGGVAAEVPTGGASTFLVVASWTGMLTQGIQCMNGVFRVAACATGGPETLNQLDQNNLYTTSMLVIDGIGVLSGLSSLPLALRNLWAVLARQRSFIARGLSLERLQAMNRMERMRVIQDIVGEASRTPEGQKALIQYARNSGVGAKSIQSTAGLSVQNAGRMVRGVSEETIRRLRASLLVDVGGTIGGVIASGTRQELTGSASGSVNWIINVIDGQTAAVSVEI